MIQYGEIHTGWRRWWRRSIECLIYIGHFPQKSLIISCSSAKKDLQQGRHSMGLCHPVIYIRRNLYCSAVTGIRIDCQLWWNTQTHICLYICIHRHMYIYVYIYGYVSIYIYIYVYINVCIYIYVSTCVFKIQFKYTLHICLTYISIYLYVYILCMYIHIYIHTHVCVCAYTHARTQTCDA